jgi:hypothetical protein
MYLPFDETKPVYQAARDSAIIRAQFYALFCGDLSPLRARAQASPDLTVQVNGTDIESYWRQTWISVSLPFNYGGGNSPAITKPSSNSRIALLTIDAAGTLSWTYGEEAGSPTPPNTPSGQIPICWVYERTTMSGIYNYEDAGDHTSDGYIYRDVRPFLNLGGFVQTPTLSWSVPGTLNSSANPATPPFIVTGACTLVKAYAVITTAPASQAVIIDIHKNGTTIWTTQANRLQIAAGQNSGTQESFDTVDLAEGDRLDFYIDQVGGVTQHGANLTVELKVSLT